MKYCLGVDVAAIDSMFCLVAENDEVVFLPEKQPHTFTGFNNITKKFNDICESDITVIMESTSTYHLKVERFFRENTSCKVIVINPIISSNHKRNLRKTKTDKEDCLNLVDIYFKSEYNMQAEHDYIYLELQFISRQIQHLQEGATRTRNRLKQFISMINPIYYSVFTNDYMYSENGLQFMARWPHCDMIKNATVDELTASFAEIAKRSPNYYRKKADALKAASIDCFPATDVNSVMCKCLSDSALYLLSQQREIESLKNQLIYLASTTDLFKLYITITGIGPYLASVLVAELKDIRRFDNHKKLIAYCGLDPTIVQSGKTINYNGPISKRGNTTARKMIFYSVNVILTVARKVDPEMPLLLYYKKKRDEGKHHHASIVACCTKLLRILLAMSKQNTPYR